MSVHILFFQKCVSNSSYNVLIDSMVNSNHVLSANNQIHQKCLDKATAEGRKISNRFVEGWNTAGASVMRDQPSCFTVPQLNCVKLQRR